MNSNDSPTDTCPMVLIVDDGYSAGNWPGLRSGLTAALTGHDLTVGFASVARGRPVRDLPALAGIAALVLVDVDLDRDDLACMPTLELVAYPSGRLRPAVAGYLDRRGIVVVEGSRGRARSIAEMAVLLTLAGLRRAPSWHLARTGGARSCPDPRWQVLDTPGFVAGALEGKSVVVIGFDLVGRMVAEACEALGARVRVVANPDQGFTDDPGIEFLDPDDVPDTAQIVIAASGPGDQVLTATHVDALRRGTLVVTAGAHGIDMAAVRRRALAAEIGWATDVHDDDTPRAVTWEHTNIVALPGLAGRTQHAVDTIADILADNIVRVLGGDPPIGWDHVCLSPPRTIVPEARDGIRRVVADNGRAGLGVTPR